MANNHSELEKRLWEAADDLRANSKLKSAEYSIPVLGLIFLRYADHKFALAEKKLAQQGSGRRKVGKTDYQAQGVLFLPDEARFAHLLTPVTKTHRQDSGARMRPNRKRPIMRCSFNGETATDNTTADMRLKGF